MNKATHKWAWARLGIGSFIWKCLLLSKKKKKEEAGSACFILKLLLDLEDDN